MRWRQPHPGQGREEQDGAAVQAGGVRHPVRHGHLPRGQPHRLRCRPRDRPQVRRAWYTYDGDQLGQGKENSRNFLIENPAVALDIEQKIMLKLGIGADAKAAALAASAEAPAADAPAAKAGKAAVIPVEPVADAPAGADEFDEERLQAVGE